MEISSRCHWTHAALPSRHSAPDFSRSSSSSSNNNNSNNHHHDNNHNHSLHHHHHHHEVCSSYLPTSHSSSDNMHPVLQKKRSGSHCDLCGKRLLKLAGWRNYFTLPCRCRHVFCKQCITGRLQCRQKVMRSASYDLMWTFPCPGSAQCGQELNVDWSRGSSYSKNLVARDLGSTDDSYEQEEEGGEEEEEVEAPEEEEADEGSVFEEPDVSERGHHRRHRSDVTACGGRAVIDREKSVHFEI